VIDWSQDPEGGPAGNVGRDPSSMLDSRSQLQQVRAILGDMNKHQVEALMLHDVLEHNLGEIAVMVGASVPAVQSRLFRGRRELRRRLQKAGLHPWGEPI
jgi:DNA-directed RNA polymerase specialized sigma24 family protein